MNNNFKYTCLFGGGAIRGVSYIGAIKALEEFGINPNRLAGSSVGSIIAALLAVGYNASELKDIFIKVNFELFRDISIGLGPLFALSKGEVFLEWVRELIEKKYYGDKYKKGTNPAVTFNDIDYAILDEIDNFIYTVNVNNANDIKIFKTKIEEDNEILEELSEEEQSIALVKFYEKHKDLVSTNE